MREGLENDNMKRIVWGRLIYEHWCYAKGNGNCIKRGAFVVVEFRGLIIVNSEK
jgi:hypothetical protein